MSKQILEDSFLNLGVQKYDLNSIKNSNAVICQGQMTARS